MRWDYNLQNPNNPQYEILCRLLSRDFYFNLRLWFKYIYIIYVYLKIIYSPKIYPDQPQVTLFLYDLLTSILKA